MKHEDLHDLLVCCCKVLDRHFYPAVLLPCLFRNVAKQHGVFFNCKNYLTTFKTSREVCDDIFVVVNQEKGKLK